MLALLFLVSSVALHSAWPGPGLPPPDYNALVGDPIPANAPEERWTCTMNPPGRMGRFEVRISNGKLKRVFARSEFSSDVVTNSTLGVVAISPVDDVENGQPGIGDFTFALNKMTGQATFASAFAGQKPQAPADGHCIRLER